ncbi:MAG TPA: primosomal protein N' [Conexibacter sp.]|nr:primosomal protein N' [Conexibacter sp.]
MPPIARVEPLTTTRALRGPFDYRLPEALADADVGTLLSVPFAGRELLGVVVELAATSDVPDERLAEPRARVEPAIPADLVALARWIGEEYCSTFSRALGLVLPSGAGRGVAPRVRIRTALVAEISDAGRLALTDGARLTAGQRGLLERLRDEGPLTAATSGMDHGSLRRLADRGLLLLEPRAQQRRPLVHAVGARSAHAPALTAEQQAALEPVLAALGGAPVAGSDPVSPADRRFLLHGVTGSGKTEVYLQAAEAALAAGRSVLVLVPEIALAPQTVARFQARFGDTVAVLHSQLGQGERYDEWLRLANGEARIAVGPRSAVFAPLHDLGLVIVDEEHESAYKHEGDPRYDARRVAAKRAADAGAVLLAGSATPRPESVQAFARLRLTRRVDGRPLPAVEILDMRDARHPLHPATREALGDVRRAGRKAIVLVNRRGWSNFLSCRHCGVVWTCPQCDVALVLHQREGALACHHCGHRERIPTACTHCHSASVARHGAGTERIETELLDALGDPDFPILRLDADTARGGKGAVARTLERFDRAQAGVLVGTQMVAKGHDFPDVTLGVVLDADQTLRFPDFRAEERTFALVAQLAGRAGRGGDGHGRVLVQTLSPEAPSIAAAAKHDADGFLAGELARRRALAYPPFASLIRVTCSAEEAGDAAAAAQAVGERVSAPDAMVLGPAPLFRLRGRERSQLVVKAPRRRAAIASVAAAVDAVARSPLGRRVQLSADVDPQ